LTSCNYGINVYDIHSINQHVDDHHSSIIHARLLYHVPYWGSEIKNHYDGSIFLRDRHHIIHLNSYGKFIQKKYVLYSHYETGDTLQFISNEYYVSSDRRYYCAFVLISFHDGKEIASFKTPSICMSFMSRSSGSGFGYEQIIVSKRIVSNCSKRYIIIYYNLGSFFKVLCFFDSFKFFKLVKIIDITSLSSPKRFCFVRDMYLFISHKSNIKLIIVDFND
jgi:hypothetical protein